MPNPAANEFFNSLPSEKEAEQDYNIFEETKPERDEAVAPVAVQPEEGEDEPERKKPLRSERRVEKQTKFMEEKWQEERDARIRLEEQVKALVQGRKIEADPDIKRLLTEVKDPEEATEIFNSLLTKAGKEAEDRAFKRYQDAQSQGDNEVNEIHGKIEDSLDLIEERYGVDFEGNETLRNAFLDYVDAIAPPDSDALPNMQKAWEFFSKTQKAGTSQVQRKSDISSRGLTRSQNMKPKGEDLKPVTFDELNRGTFWDKLIGKQ